MAIGKTTPDPRLIAKVWAKDLWKDIAVDRYWGRFMGTGQNNPIQVLNDIKGKGKGDNIRIPLIYKMEGPGVVGCNTLKGNEEQLKEDAMNVTVDMLRHGVRFECEKWDWLHVYDIHEKAKELFRMWWSERDDKEIFDKLAASPTNKRLADVSTLSTGGRPTAGAPVLNDIVVLKEMARMARPKIRPLRIDGADHYVLVMHPYVARALRTSTEWKNIQMTANVRGESNPIFRGALGIYDGVVLHEHEFVNTTGDISGTTGKANNLFFGQQAGVWVQSKDVFWRYDNVDDYGRELGIGTGMIYGFKKAVFEDGYGTDGPQDYGLLTYRTACRVGGF